MTSISVIKKRAVSPVIATVLLIALVVAAVAIVYFVVFPMLQGEPSLVVVSTTLSDTNGDKRVDQILINYKNVGSSKAVISSITLYSYNTSLPWSIDKTLPFSVGTNKQEVVTLSADSIVHALSYPSIAYIQTNYGKDGGIVLTTNIDISSEYSPVVLVYNENFNSYSDGYVPPDWYYHFVAQHNPTGTHTMDDWQVQGGTLKVMANDCSYVILNGSTGYLYSNVNISFDLKANDNDELGIIFRWTNDGGKEKFYYVSYTSDHSLTSHWGGDNVQKGYLTFSYVEDGTLTILNSTSFTRNDNQWYTYRVVADGNNFKIYINDVLYLDTSNSLLTDGYIGLASAAMNGAQFDNILVWTGE